mmetsp:Transcript_23246/g.64538  ORF Transcript_23246/g.64538 Transcript_23246/m.64538 type:complete len:218 (+) Transcript_23246:1031-1684(+)
MGFLRLWAGWQHAHHCTGPFPTTDVSGLACHSTRDPCNWREGRPDLPLRRHHSPAGPSAAGTQAVLPLQDGARGRRWSHCRGLGGRQPGRLWPRVRRGKLLGHTAVGGRTGHAGARRICYKRGKGGISTSNCDGQKGRVGGGGSSPPPPPLRDDHRWFTGRTQPALCRKGASTLRRAEGKGGGGFTLLNTLHRRRSAHHVAPHSLHPPACQHLPGMH